MIEGTLDAGAACRNDYECPYNAGCWAGGIDFAYNACRPSMCVHIPDRVGEACTDTTGGLCFTGLTCLGGACATKGGAGDSCATGQPACAFGLICDAATCRRRSDGGSCNVDGQCVPTQYCSRAGQCTPRIAVGGACGDQSSSCVSFAACAAGVCVPAGHVGQPCNAQVDFQNLCVEGVCLSNRCVHPLLNGQGCFLGAQCASHGCDVVCKACGS